LNVHKLLIKDEYFKDVKSGLKKFEIRRNNRQYCIGDILALENIKTKEIIRKEIEYITDASIYDLNNILILGIK
jgi:ASC-1-like (ASCH) protein